MKTDIQTFKAADLLASVALVAPSVALSVHWEHDDDARWDIEDETLDADDFTAWQSEVRATAILGGKILAGSAYMGGTWEKFGDEPAESNPEISGYLPQMIKEALRELGQQITDLPLSNQIIAAIKTL